MFASGRRKFLAGAASALAAGLAPLRTTPALARRLEVAASFTVIQDIAQNVAGDLARVTSITKPGAEIHDYQPTPHDVMRARSAELILWNGLNLERWLGRFLEQAQGIPTAILTTGIEPIPISEGPYANQPNPHAWMSPALGRVYADNAAAVLAKVDPANADAYRANAGRYKEQLLALEARLKARLAMVPASQRWLVTSEGAFSYLARDIGFRELYLWPINADEQGTPQQVRRVIDAIRQHKIPVIFSESTVSDKPARTVARETGARYGGVLYVDSLSAPDGPVPTYLKLLEVTVETIARGFEA